MRDHQRDNTTFKNTDSYENFEYIEKIIRSLENNSNNDVSNLSGDNHSFSDFRQLINNLTQQRLKLRELHTKCTFYGNKDLSSTILKKMCEYREQFCFIENLRNFSDTQLTTDEQDLITLTNAFLSNIKTKLYRPILTRFYWNQSSNDRKLFYKACKYNSILCAAKGGYYRYSKN